MDLFRLLKRFIPPYRGKVVLNVVFNLLSTILSLFSFAAIIPVLHILFGIKTGVADYTPFAWTDDILVIADALKNNLFWWLGCQITENGAGWVLFLLGLFLVAMTGLKCLCTYLASFFMIPIQIGRAHV